ncbi:MAG: C1 family peptidase, partial [Candidatus Saccharibacteria bacterium]
MVKKLFRKPFIRAIDLLLCVLFVCLVSSPLLAGEFDYLNQPQIAQSSGFAGTQALTETDLMYMSKQVADKGYTFKVGPNSATRRPLTSLCGFKMPKDELKAAPESQIQALAALPSSWDWRAQGGTTPIKDQGNCGSCWSFGTIGPMESAIKIKDKTTVDLSEQYLLSCNTKGYSCSGGWWCFDMLTNPGAVLESCQPYKASKVACNSTCSKPYKLSGWGYVSGQYSIPSVDAMKTAIYTYGPIGVAVAADSYFQSYTGGVFNHNYGGQVNHAVVLVGWDDSKGAW